MRKTNLKTQAIIPLAGSGKRLKADVPKPLLVLNRRPMLFHVLRQFDDCRLVDSTIIVTKKKYFEMFAGIVRRYGIKKPVSFVEGGKTRADSVSNGLKKLDPQTEIVVIHDGARPLVQPGLIDECVRQAVKTGAVIAAVPVKPTIKQFDKKTGLIQKTLDRALLCEVQTPQVFRREIISKAYAHTQRAGATDDASLVEKMGVQVKIVRGDNSNIKITTIDDIAIAEFLLKKRG